MATSTAQSSATATAENNPETTEERRQDHQASTEPEASSPGSNADDLRCTICESGREIEVQFKDCLHAACAECVENIVARGDCSRTWFSCPWCRTVIREVGMLSRATEAPLDVVLHGETCFAIYAWEPVGDWMAPRAEEVDRRLDRVEEEEMQRLISRAPPSLGGQRDEFGY